VNIFALWGFSLKEILVASFIAPRMGKYPDAISVGDIMRKNYGKTGMVVSGIMAFAVCAGILGAQVGATGYIFNVFLGIPRFHSILIGCGIVIAYSTVGGMRSVVLTDVVQFVILAIGIPLTLILGINHVGGWSAMIDSVPKTHFAFPGTGKTMAQFIAFFLAFVFGETLVPPYVQRLFLSKKSSHTVKGTLFSGLFSIPFFAVTGFIGIVALAIKPDLDPNSAMPFVISTVLPVGLKGLVVAGVISIVMSSADSFLNSASVAITHDVVEPLRNKKMSVSRELLFV
ncbi:MAG: sodium:solute symporter family protein, partial [Deltaproteobacteria bacterium]|nr:sodium:solute symporter family protein [Deltaproteobacteria bacterium]